MKLSEYIDGLSGKRVAVAGAGISNTPLIEKLLSAGIDTVVCDKRNRCELGDTGNHFENLGARLRLGDDYLENPDADVIFRTPGLMPSNKALKEAVRRGAELTSEMEVFFDVCPCRIIAVTGSDGKTTTTSIIAELLKNEGRNVHVGGNIGVPLLCMADDIRPDDIVVLELSSFQLITMKKSPDIAVFTNLAPNHLDVHRDMEEYADAKRNIFLHQKSADRVVLNFDNDYTRAYAQDAPAGEILFFSRREKVCDGVFYDDGAIFEVSGGRSGRLMEAEDIFLPGVHNLENFMAAFAAVRGFVSHSKMLETARTFRGVRHRIELVRELRGVKYYNDSIATSPTRTIAGLRAFNRKVILIAGGKDKNIPFDALGSEIIARVKTLVLTGLTAEKIKKAVSSAPGYAGAPDIIIREDFKEAVLTASKTASEGDVVLLSPACTSFDRFKSFEERGEFFREIVSELRVES